MPGRMRSRNSTTITFAPSRRQTEPSSSPITPAPTTRSFCGHLGEHERAGRGHDALLVDRDALEPRDVGAGGDDDRLGVERLASCRRRPSPRPCRARRCGRRPETLSILFFLNRKATPLTLPSTPSSLNFIMAARSSVGRADLDAHRCRTMWPASSNSSEACSSAFDGMQPTLRQVPPKVLSFSTTRPSCRAAPRGWRRRSRRDRSR